MVDITKEQALRVLENKLYNIKHTTGIGRDIQSIILERKTYEYCIELINSNTDIIKKNESEVQPMRYIVQVAGEVVVEAENMLQAKEKLRNEDYEETAIQPVSTPIPEELLYSMEPQDVEETAEEEYEFWSKNSD